MASYKEMYLLMARQINRALRLLREARIDQIYQAIDLLENAQRDAEALYVKSDNVKPFVSVKSVKNSTGSDKK